jgi:branched-subunit amino acid ABC-type transport system permease component
VTAPPVMLMELGCTLMFGMMYSINGARGAMYRLRAFAIHYLLAQTFLASGHSGSRVQARPESASVPGVDTVGLRSDRPAGTYL